MAKQYTIKLVSPNSCTNDSNNKKKCSIVHSQKNKMKFHTWTETRTQKIMRYFTLKVRAIILITDKR